jgi:N-acyl homoserine lactone hydrolase
MRLYVLDYGSIELQVDALLPGEGEGKWMTVGVPGYLIRADDGKVILVDTGIPRTYVDDPVGTAERDGMARWMRTSPGEENLPAGQLAKIGMRPEDVTHVVVTHTHFDHAGGLGDFPEAVHVIQRAERELATPVYPGFTWPEDVQWQIVDGDAALAEGVELLATPGHSPGHMSVMVELPKTGKVLLAIDAIYLPASLERDNFQASWDEEMAKASGHKVARIAEEEGAWLMFGHDPAQWATVRKAPEFYE